MTLLDASAIIVFLQGEPGAAVVRQALQTGRCVVGAANLAEVIAKSIDRGIAPETIKAILAELSITVIDLPVHGLQCTTTTIQGGLMALKFLLGKVHDKNENVRRWPSCHTC